MVKSPCENKCYRENGVCGYCGRTIPEITSWTKLTDEQKKEVIQDIKENREADKWR